MLTFFALSLCAAFLSLTGPQRVCKESSGLGAALPTWAASCAPWAMSECSTRACTRALSRACRSCDFRCKGKGKKHKKAEISYTKLRRSGRLGRKALPKPARARETHLYNFCLCCCPNFCQSLQIHTFYNVQCSMPWCLHSLYSIGSILIFRMNMSMRTFKCFWGTLNLVCVRAVCSWIAVLTIVVVAWRPLMPCNWCAYLEGVVWCNVFLPIKYALHRRASRLTDFWGSSPMSANCNHNFSNFFLIEMARSKALCEYIFIFFHGLFATVWLLLGHHIVVWGLMA